jgi:hypothetical protein
MKMRTTGFKAEKFKVYGNGHCKYSKLAPDQESVIVAIQRARKKPLAGNAIIILRYNLLKNMKLQIPENMEMANLCLIFKGGKEYLGFYSNDLTHIVKKQNYHIQILN